MHDSNARLATIRVFARAFILATVLVGTLAVALGASTYAMSAMSANLWEPQEEKCANTVVRAPDFLATLSK